MKNDIPYIFDLTGVLFTIDKLKFVKQLGFWRTFMYALTERKNPVDRYLKTLHELAQREPQTGPQLQHYDYFFPKSVSALLMGKAVGSDVASKLISDIEILDREGFFSSQREYELIRHITTLAFATDRQVASFKPIKPMIALVKELRSKPSVKLFLLSNLDEPSFRSLENIYSDFFTLFDGITVSSRVHMIKPYENIYQHVLSTYQIDPQKALFIDDQPENIATARTLGLKTVHFTSAKSAIEAARNHLKDAFRTKNLPF